MKMATVSEYNSNNLNHVYIDGKISFIRNAWLIIYYSFRYPLRETTMFYNGISKYNSSKSQLQWETPIIWRFDEKGNITGREMEWPDE